MNNIKNQIKHLENNILLKENKLKKLGNEIAELNEKYKTTHNELLKQEYFLFKKKEHNISLEIKINNLKIEKVDILNDIDIVNNKIDKCFEELKIKKLEIKKNKEKIEKIIEYIKNTIYNDKKDSNLILLDNFLKEKMKQNCILEKKLKKKKKKMNLLKEKIIIIKKDIYILSQKTFLLFNEIEYHLQNFKNYINEKMKYTLKEENDKKHSIYSTCLNIINQNLEEQIEKKKLIDKYKIDNINEQNQYNEKFDNINENLEFNKINIIDQKLQNEESLSNNINSNEKEMKLQLGMNTQEFLEL